MRNSGNSANDHGAESKPLRSQKRAFTLIELVVSMGIFAMLGAALMLVLRGGLATWNKGEARRESSQVAQSIFTMLREDFQSVTIYRQRLGKSGLVETKLLCDFEIAHATYGGASIQTYRQRLFLTRSLKAESENAVTGLAGTALHATGYVDFHNDSQEALSQNLRATGGLMEVAYLRAGQHSDVLYRAVRSPIGGPLTVFNWDGLPTSRIDPERRGLFEQLQPSLSKIAGVKVVHRSKGKIILYHVGSNTNSGILRLAHEEPKYRELKAALDKQEMSLEACELASGTSIESLNQDLRCQTWAQPVATNVLFFGLEFWHERTGSWDSKRFIDRGDADLGPLDYWDSTRGILNDESDSKAYKLFRFAASEHEPRDDVLPRRVRVTLVIREHASAGTETELLSDVSATDDEISMAAPGRAPAAPGYVRLGHEWIKYEAVVGNSLTVASKGRGARGTTAASHPAGSEVIFGRVFRAVVEIPAYVENWDDE